MHGSQLSYPRGGLVACRFAGFLVCGRDPRPLLFHSLVVAAFFFLLLFSFLSFSRVAPSVPQSFQSSLLFRLSAGTTYNHRALRTGHQPRPSNQPFAIASLIIDRYRYKQPVVSVPYYHMFGPSSSHFHSSSPHLLSFCSISTVSFPYLVKLIPVHQAIQELTHELTHSPIELGLASIFLVLFF